MREEIIKAIREEGLIVILRGVEKASLIPLVEAMYRGGVRLLEITYSADGRVSDEETAAEIGMLANHFAGRMYIGAGTVLTERQVALTKEAGGGFIISPGTQQSVIEATRKLGLVSIPGALTPTEIESAHRFGADFVKLFPVTALGPAYVKAVTAPLSHIPLLAVGGIELENIPLYRKAGVCGFGVGANIADRELIAKGDFRGITALAAAYVAAVKGAV